MSGGVGSEAEMTFPEANRARRRLRIRWLHRARSQRRRITGARDARPVESGLARELSRESLFRRALLAADVVAIVGAFVVLAAISVRALQLTWVSVCGLLTLLLGAKVLGLYDRDDVLLHKTTLDEAPKLFQVATLGALVAWLAGGFVINGDLLSRREALLLWLVLILLLVVARSTRPHPRLAGVASRTVPVHRRPGVGADDQFEARRARRRQGRAGRAPRPRPRGDVVGEHLLGAAALGDPRSGAHAQRAPRDRRAEQRRRWRDARSGAHAEGGGSAGQRAAAPAGGGGLLGRVRRSPRRDADGSQTLRADALLGGRQARLRPARRLAGAAGGGAAVRRDRGCDQARRRGPVFFRQRGSGATGSTSTS